MGQRKYKVKKLVQSGQVISYREFASRIARDVQAEIDYHCLRGDYSRAEDLAIAHNIRWTRNADKYIQALAEGKNV